MINPPFGDNGHNPFHQQKYYETTAHQTQPHINRQCRFKHCEAPSVIEGFCPFHYNIVCQHESRYLLKNAVSYLQEIHRILRRYEDYSFPPPPPQPFYPPKTDSFIKEPIPNIKPLHPYSPYKPKPKPNAPFINDQLHPFKIHKFIDNLTMADIVNISQLSSTFNIGIINDTRTDQEKQFGPKELNLDLSGHIFGWNGTVWTDYGLLWNNSTGSTGSIPDTSEWVDENVTNPNGNTGSTGSIPDTSEWIDENVTNPNNTPDTSEWIDNLYDDDTSSSYIGQNGETGEWINPNDQEP